jgi:hypothetical protein
MVRAAVLVQKQRQLLYGMFCQQGQLFRSRWMQMCATRRLHDSHEGCKL